ncbi:MAG: VWA domain-containing protein [Haloarculaceae archaeon]
MTRLTAEVDRTTVAAGGSSVTASVRIQPGMTDSDVERHIALCIDKSGSMAGEKIEQVREGLRWTFGYLDDGDHLSIVAFDDEVTVLLPSTRWGDIGLDEAEAIVEDLEPGGGTNIRQALETAHETLADLSAGDDVGRRILLLSDGRDESTTTETFADLAGRMRREDGISVPAAGIGDFYDEASIRAIGTASDAEWVHLSRAEDIKNFFGRKVETLRTIVAPSPNLEITLPEGATVDEVLLRQPQVRDANYERVGDTIRVFLPDLLEFEAQEVLFTLHTPPREVGQRFTLADLVLNTRNETTTTAIEVESTAETAGMETQIESQEVALRQVETMVRKAASEGDLERAETIVEQATGEADPQSGPGADAQETRIRDDVATSPDASSQEEGADAQETRIRGGRVADLSDVVDDEKLSELQTVIEQTSEDDLEAQYETTKIADGDRT